MTAIHPSEVAILEACSAEPMLQQVHDWSVVNSGSHNLAGLARMAEMLADAFSVLPGTLVLEDAAAANLLSTNGELVPVEHGRNLHLMVRPQAPLQLLLTGHMDTVYAADHPFQTLGWREDGVLGGPGVADMKGGIAAMLAALKAFEQSPAAQRTGYEVVINSDEEVGSPGSAALIARAAQGKRAAFTYEPAIDPEGTLAGARPGSGNFSILVTGRSAHAGRNPQDGRNALVATADLALRLAAAATPELSVNPARIDGGGPNNMVPDKSILRVNLRPRSVAARKRAEALIARAIKAVAQEHDVAISLHGTFGRPPKPLDAGTRRLLGFVARCAADLGQRIEWRDSGGVCDGNNIASHGIPVVDTMGVRGGNIHSMDEYLIVESLVERAQLSTLALTRLASGETA